MSSAMKKMVGIFGYTWWHSRNKGWVSFSEASGICIRNDSKRASASLSASLVSFKRQSSLCIVIRAEILASCVNISKWKGASSPRPEVFFNTQSNRTYFCFSFSDVGAKAGTSTSPNVVGHCVSSVVFSYCLRYVFLDRVPVGWDAASYVVKACFSSSESLREATVMLSSSGRTEITLQDFSLAWVSLSPIVHRWQDLGAPTWYPRSLMSLEWGI